MPRAILGTITVRTSAETKDWFKNSFESSNANSQGDFLQKLLERWNNDEPTPEPEVRTVTIEREKDLNENQFVLTLTPAQKFALRNHVLSFPNYADRQNSIIDSLRGSRPFLYGGNLFDLEFRNIFIRNIPITKTMTEAENESAISHNMAAFLVNTFLVNIIEGKIKETTMSMDKLKSFIQATAKKENIINPITPKKDEPL